MRPVSGLDRPLVQWVFVALAAVLVAVSAAASLALRRAKADVVQLRTAAMDGALDRRQLELQLSRERAARETLSRGVAAVPDGGPTADSPPTLTLAPRAKLTSTPPSPTVQPPVPDRVVELRLMLPSRVPPGGPYTVSMRSWSGGDAIWMRSGLTGVIVESGTAVVVRVAGDALPAGAYEFTLKTGGADGHEVCTYELAIGQPRQTATQR